MYSYLVYKCNFIIRTDKVVRLSPISHVSSYVSSNDRFTFTSFDRAKLAIDLRINFPERVRGNALTAAAVLKDAMGPIKFLTRATNSSLICFSFLIASTETDTWYYQQGYSLDIDIFLSQNLHLLSLYKDTKVFLL